MKVTFDSNTWRKVASPDNFPKDPINGDYRIIREAINKGTVIPFISETIFTLEAINKKDRKTFFRDYKSVIDVDISEGKDGSINIGFVIGPNENAHPGNNDFLKEHLGDAVKLGFNIIHLPRIAGITNKEIKAYMYKMDNETLGSYLTKVFEVGRRITSLEAGDYEIEQIGLRYDPKEWFKGIGNAPDSENGNINKAVAEWADGDSIASHIAIGGDYFCTNDKAVSGGIKSVFNENNLQILETEYGFKPITPTTLANIIKTIEIK
jgi:hypothetical protein